jgi:hypothetical protein
MGRLHTTATSPTDLFGKLAAWVEGAGVDDLGWTLVDTLTSTDKVYSIAGQDIVRPTIYVRMTMNVFDEAPGSNPIGNQENIVFRIYRSWSTGTHTGKGETGRIGPRIVIAPYFKAHYHVQKLGLFLPASEQYSVELNPFTNFKMQEVSSWAFNGRGVYYLCNSLTGLFFYDFSTHKTSIISHVPADERGVNNLLILTNDSDGFEYLWVMIQTDGGLYSSSFRRYDVHNDTWSAALADPPWGDFWYDYRPWAWDGADTLYMAKGETPESTLPCPFAKYSILTNTWTVLADIPFIDYWSPNNTYVNYSQMVYVPATLSGHAHDEIYAAFIEGGYNQWRRYDVVTDAWITSPTGIANLPVNNTFARLWLDPTIGNHGTIFGILINPITQKPSNLYAYDIANNVWSDQIYTWNATEDIWKIYSYEASLGITSFTSIRTYAGALYLPRTLSINIEAIGNKDFISIVSYWQQALHAPPIQRWVYAGFYQSYMKTDKFTASSGFGNGKNVTVTLTETVTGLLVEKDFVEIYDPVANVVPQAKGQPYVSGGGEVCQIVSILNEHQIVLDTVSHSYSAGVLLGQDIASAVVGNDCQMFCALRGENGFYFSGEADLYHATPLIAEDKAGAFGKRSIGVLSGLQLSQNNPALNSYNTVGELYGVWTANFLSDTSNEDLPQYEVRNGVYYFIFSPYLKRRLSDPRNFEIGPVLAP